MHPGRADVIAAQREALARGAKTIAISNVADSTISRESSARSTWRATVTLCTSVGPSTVAMISPFPPRGMRLDTPSAPWRCVAREPIDDMICDARTLHAATY